MTYIVSSGALNSTHSLTLLDRQNSELMILIELQYNTTKTV